MEIDWPSIVFLQPDESPTSGVIFTLFVAAAGAVFGGLISFLTTYFFQRRSEQKQLLLNCWALYLSLMKTFNDVFSASSRYLGKLDHDFWPIEPWTVMPALIGDSDTRFSIPSNQLATLTGANAKGLVNDILELVNFRNIILTASNEYSARRNALMTAVADKSELGPGMQMTTELVGSVDKALLIEVRTIDDLAKQLLGMLVRFQNRQLDIANRYNDFTSSHSLKAVRGFKAEFHDLQPW